MNQSKLAAILEQAERWPIEAQEEALAALEGIEENWVKPTFEDVPDRVDYLGRW